MLIVIIGTAKGAFACADDDACEAISCSDCCDDDYTEYYRCVGNERQRLWQYSDCRREWRTIETCSYGCTDGYCSKCTSIRAQVSPSTPADRFEQETVYTTVRVHNIDDRGAYFDIDVYLCEADGGCDECSSSCDSCTSECRDDILARNCREMKCDDTHLYVPGESTRYVKCSRFVRDGGDYRVKVVYSSGNYQTKRTVYSDVFEVRGECSEGVGDYRCFGKYRQQKYINDDCDARWRNVEYCEYGCDNGACVQPTVLPKLGEPDIFMRTQYEMEKCKLSSFTFTIRNDGETDTFSIETSGDVASWIETAPTATIERGETKTITAYASVPCDASTGDHEFTITASSKTSDSRVGVIKVPSKQGLFTTTPENDLMIVLVIIIVFVFAVSFFKQGFSEIGFGTKRRRESGAEEFKVPLVSKIFKKA